MPDMFKDCVLGPTPVQNHLAHHLPGAVKNIILNFLKDNVNVAQAESP